MTEKDKVFFAENGLTASSAGHICTVASERRAVLESKLNGVSLVNKEVLIVATNARANVSYGWSNQDLKSIPEMLNEIGELDALQAWLKEAIKAKERATLENSRLSFEAWKVILGVEEEDEPTWKTDLKEPVRPRDITGDDVLASWSIKDRQQIYNLNSRAALIGKYLGKDGAYTKARTEFLMRHNNRADVHGEGQDTTMYIYETSVDDWNEQELISQLEQMHRSLNAELNSMLHRVEMEGRTLNNNRTAEYETQLADYNMAYRKERNEFNAKHEEWQAHHKELELQYIQWKTQEQTRIQELKIVIPNALVEIYNKLK